jgi:predicted amidophosphoribosyltransferase
MALIQCPECHRSVSDKAVTCPSCGYPVARTPHGQRSVHVIEKTARRWKGVRVLGWLLIVVGGLVLFPEWAAAHSSGEWLGSWIGSAGVACLWVSRVGAWWYHG